jgi:undecaprenyl-diphosphatase
MNIFQSFLLGIIEGLTEFIPVSSTAHLLIAQSLLRINETNFPQMFQYLVLIQLGALLALILYFWNDLWKIIREVLLALSHGKPFETFDARLGWYLVLATIPAAIVGLIFQKRVENFYLNFPDYEAAIRLFVTAILLFLAERFTRKSRKIGEVNWLDALWIGIFQVLSVIPGSSRSGSTISGGMARGFDRPAAARFAFLMAIPIMLGAGAKSVLDLVKTPHFSSVLPQFAVGFIMAGIVGWVAIRWLLGYLNRHSLYIFSIYCLIAGVVALGISVLLR